MIDNERNNLLKDYFKRYTINDEFINCQFIYNINESEYQFKIEVRFYALQPHILINYGDDELQKYITEILVQLLKAKCNLPYVNIVFNPHLSYPLAVNLGKFAGMPLIK